VTNNNYEQYAKDRNTGSSGTHGRNAHNGNIAGNRGAQSHLKANIDDRGRNAERSDFGSTNRRKSQYCRDAPVKDRDHHGDGGRRPQNYNDEWNQHSDFADRSHHVNPVGQNQFQQLERQQQCVNSEYQDYRPNLARQENLRRGVKSLAEMRSLSSNVKVTDSNKDKLEQQTRPKDQNGDKEKSIDNVDWAAAWGSRQGGEKCQTNPNGRNYRGQDQNVHCQPRQYDGSYRDRVRDDYQSESYRPQEGQQRQKDKPHQNCRYGDDNEDIRSGHENDMHQNRRNRNHDSHGRHQDVGNRRASVYSVGNGRRASVHNNARASVYKREFHARDSVAHGEAGYESLSQGYLTPANDDRRQIPGGRYYYGNSRNQDEPETAAEKTDAETPGGGIENRNGRNRTMRNRKKHEKEKRRKSARRLEAETVRQMQTSSTTSLIPLRPLPPNVLLKGNGGGLTTALRTMDQMEQGMRSVDQMEQGKPVLDQSGDLNKRNSNAEARFGNESFELDNKSFELDNKSSSATIASSNSADPFPDLLDLFGHVPLNAQSNEDAPRMDAVSVDREEHSSVAESVTQVGDYEKSLSIQNKEQDVNNPPNANCDDGSESNGEDFRLSDLSLLADRDSYLGNRDTDQDRTPLIP